MEANEIDTQIELVRSIIGPHHDALRDAVLKALDRWKRDVRGAMPLHPPTVRANMIWGLMVDEARQRFGAIRGVHIVDRDQRFLVVFRNRVVVRFKKLNEAHETANYPTPAAILLDEQQTIEGIPAGTIIVSVGYVLDSQTTEIDSVLVTFKDARWKWEYSLTAASSAPVAQLELPNVQPPLPRVRAKSGVKLPDRKRTAGHRDQGSKKKK
jgi:hypothetical protein